MLERLDSAVDWMLDHGKATILIVSVFIAVTLTLVWGLLYYDEYVVHKGQHCTQQQTTYVVITTGKTTTISPIISCVKWEKNSNP